MEKKRKLKKFASQTDYETQKDSVMGFPHVVLLEDTKGLVYQPDIPAIDYPKEYFTIESLEDGLTVSFSKSGLEYKVNSGTWNILDSGVNTTAVNTGDKISFRGTLTPNSSSGIGTFTISKKCSAQGNTMSLLFGDDFESKTDLTGYSYAFYKLFYNCTTLTDASNLILPTTILAESCYRQMFYGCTNLTEAPELPATTLVNRCYNDMFRNCTSLTTSPALPAKTLASNCYQQMFQNCTNLTTAPELPATTLADACYSYMFANCTSLTTAPELPATTLAYACYSGMFRCCTNLTGVPALPATTLASYCYSNMFNGCTNLTGVPALPATTLASYCYSGMFQGCTSLNHITMLATDISASDCLTNWVDGVSSSGTFVKSPSMTSLPSGSHGIPTGWEINNMSPCIINSTPTSITFNYTNGMFTPNKESIELSEYLSKEELLSIQPSCDIVISLYDKTGNLLASDYVWEYAKTLGDVLSELYITTDIYGLSVVITEVYEPEDNGYYYYLMEETLTEYPEPFVEKDYMRIVSLEDDNTITFSQTIQYSINGSNWKDIYSGGVTVNNGDKVYLKNSGYGQNITSTKNINVEGNIMSLIYGVDFEDKKSLSNNPCYQLFNGCTTLTDASNLLLPATTLSSYCYYLMFNGCTSLTTAPELPATTLADACYSYMFANCTSLTTAPELPATTLKEKCYKNMFQSCTGLTVAPELPATTLAESCYEYMFNGCTSLTVAPELPATTLAMGCYEYMFAYCKSLTVAPELPTTTLAGRCYYGMFEGCYNLTVAPALPATTLASQCYHSMFKKCTSLANTPELPATTLANYCYGYMFNGCSNLNHITMLATDISASSCLTNWVSGVASSGVFVKSPSMTSLPSGSSGIPTGWSVEDA